MTWIIIGLVVFFIHIYVLKHTVWAEAKGYNYPKEDEYQPLAIPIWVVILMLITALTPILNVIVILPFWGVWIKKYADPDCVCTGGWYTYWRFRDKFLSKTI